MTLKWQFDLPSIVEVQILRWRERENDECAVNIEH